MLTKEVGRSSRIDDEVVQDQRQRDDNDLQDERQDQPKEEEVEPRRSKRARIEKSFGPDFVSFMVENEPTSYREALVDLLPSCKPLGYKWIFKKKMKADGTTDKYKARLVIKGFRQREGLGYFNTYWPITRITSIRMILAIAALRKLEVHQMDVKMTFLNGDLEKIFEHVSNNSSFSIETLQDFGNMHIFKRTFSQDLDLLENHLTKEIISQTDCKTTLTKLRTTFENAFNSELKARMQNYTRYDAQSFYDAMIFNMDSLGKYMLELILHQQRTPQLLKQKKLMQTQEDHLLLIPALNVD
ncbi:calcineurin B-like protein 4 [Tanacetum coccineum]